MIVKFPIFAPLTNEKVCLLPFCDAWKHLPSLNWRKWDIRPYICIGHKKVCSWDLGSFAAIGAKYTVQTKFVLKENYSRYFCDDKLLQFKLEGAWSCPRFKFRSWQVKTLIKVCPHLLLSMQSSLPDKHQFGCKNNAGNCGSMVG